MARIRSIKPEFWSSPGIETVTPHARLLYIAMWNWADDSGVGVANPRELLGFTFPLEEEITVADLRRMLEEIRRVFGVKFYTVAGRQYYSIPSWEKHQKFDRRSKGKYPGPDEADDAEIRTNKGSSEDSTESHESPSSPRRDSVAGTGEQGNRGTGEQGTKAASPATPSNAPATPADEVAKYAYDSTSGALKYMAIKGLAKWAIEKKQAPMDQVKASIADLYEMGKPITKATLGQHLDGHIRGNHTRPQTEERMQDILAIGEHLDSNQHQIGA